MKTIISPLLASQVNNFADGYSEECIVMMEQTIKNGIKQSMLKKDKSIDIDEVDRISGCIVGMILEAVMITDTSAKFIADDSSPFEFMFHNMHQSYHLGADGPSGDNWYVSPVVHNDLTGMYLMFRGYNSPLKILNLVQDGDQYIIMPVTKKNTSIQQMIQWNQEPVENMKSLCYHVRGQELLDEIAENEEHMSMSGLFGDLLNILMQ